MIVKAVERAYQVAEERGWDVIYWCVDLHGVCLKPNYMARRNEFLSCEAIEGLRAISNRPESRLILWSAVYEDDQPEIIELFERAGIKVSYFNENPEVSNTATGCFDQKFYTSIILDDKAGFDPDVHWRSITNFLRYRHPLTGPQP